MGTPFTVKIDKDLEELIPNFLEGRRKELAVLKKALADKDFETLKSIGHKLKGNAPGYGFELLGVHGAALEIAGRDHKLDDAKASIEKIIDYVENVRVVFA